MAKNFLYGYFNGLDSSWAFRDVIDQSPQFVYVLRRKDWTDGYDVCCWYEESGEAFRATLAMGAVGIMQHDPVEACKDIGERASSMTKQEIRQAIKERMGSLAKPVFSHLAKEVCQPLVNETVSIPIEELKHALEFALRLPGDHE